MKIGFFTNCFLLFFSLTVFSQNQPKKKNHFQTAGYVFKTSFNTIPSDFVFLGKEVSNDWQKTGYYAAGILGLIATDKITTKAWQNYVEPNIDYQLPNITPNYLRQSKNAWTKGSNSYLTYPIIGLYFGSLLANNEKGQFAAANSFKAIAYSTLVTQFALKTIFGRNRPNRPLNSDMIEEPWTDNNWDFFNGRKNGFLFADASGTALPSMHVTTYFALAKVIQMEYDNYWIPYGVMTAVFFSNVKSHNHWISDMVVGGLVGTLIGRSIVRSSWKARGILDKKKQKTISLNYTPSFSPEFTGLRIVGTF
ncbi:MULTISPECIES: phosphatase PAP2 family protein [unclassified Polaribacter]|uniref:phosphatase PAP2 family protein n=1 Tax=unclassified Polaribacter TaxID=196858 RepID=UPI0011BDEB31|nr:MULTISPECIES: phosphatase PAP2 family protein [unclassified Polaribacter]TXD51567.1 phosphatase PAP2 family protein [Polaribacter sp. IC063]TXD61931.1 phosphatase PAP2 family protein [Polaribacter sp. IC066]